MMMLGFGNCKNAMTFMFPAMQMTGMMNGGFKPSNENDSDGSVDVPERIKNTFQLTDKKE